FAQGVGELLVLGDRLGELALVLEQPLLEGAHPLRRVLEATTQRLHLLLELGGLCAEAGELALGALCAGAGHRVGPEAVSVICHDSDPTRLTPRGGARSCRSSAVQIFTRCTVFIPRCGRVSRCRELGALSPPTDDTRGSS